ncbi:MAG: protein translocase subunit SecD [Clostridia bacterium]|nr:protein translocase subunit SecD [Clostridia bacterium]
MSKRKSIVVIIVMAIAIAILGVMCFASFPVGNTKYDFNSILSKVGRGIDLSGGYYVVLEPQGESDDMQKTLDDAMKIIRARLDDKGYTEAVITVQDSDKIRVEIPQVEDDGTVLEIIGQTGKLSFKDSANIEYLNGDHIESAYVAQNPEGEGYVVTLNFTAEGTALFSMATGKIKDMEDNRLYIWLGDSQISAPTVQTQLSENSAVITGYETYEDALSIASVIDSGRLPIEYKVSEARSISTKLGEGAIDTSAVMAGVGLLIIFAVLLIRYRGMGLAACISLICYVLLYIVFLAIIPSVQLTLPGIAGILLAIGMAVDANIVIFERIREEYGMGKTEEASVAHGFKRATVTVLDSNITTIFAAIILWLVCPGTIKGFAITLLIGIVLSLFTSLILSKWILKVFNPLVKDDAKFLNLKREGGNN